jgi:hypothetical protein
VSAAPSQTSQRPSLKARRQQSAARAAQHRLQAPRRPHVATDPSATVPSPSTALPPAGSAEDLEAAHGAAEHSPATPDSQHDGSAAPTEPGAFLETLAGLIMVVPGFPAAGRV